MPTVSIKHDGSEAAAGIQHLLAWLKSNGAFVHADICVRRTDEAGLGVCLKPTSSGIDKGELLLEVPLGCILSPANSSLDQKSGNGIAPHLILATHLLHEYCLKEASFWAPYIDSFWDEVPELPVFWSSDALEWIDGTEVQVYLSKEHDAATIFDIFQKDIVPKLPLDLYERAPTFNDYKRCISHTLSRAFYVDNFHKLSLVPFADMFVLCYS